MPIYQQEKEEAWRGSNGEREGQRAHGEKSGGGHLAIHIKFKIFCALPYAPPHALLYPLLSHHAVSRELGTWLRLLITTLAIDHSNRKGREDAEGCGEESDEQDTTGGADALGGVQGRHLLARLRPEQQLERPPVPAI